MANLSAPLGVMNVYATLTALKARLGIDDTESDAMLWHLLYVASRMVDGRCARHFYVCSKTKRFDVNSLDSVHLDDLIAPAQVVEDWDGDGVYERLRPRGEYVLYPLDADPESARGAPFHMMRTKRLQNIAHFPAGRAAVQVTGRWGYRAHFISSEVYVSNGERIRSAGRAPSAWTTTPGSRPAARSRSAVSRCSSSRWADRR